MASVEVGSLSADAKDQLVCTYAALLLHDGDLDLTVSTALTLPEIMMDRLRNSVANFLLLLLIGGQIEQGHQGLWQHC